MKKKKLKQKYAEAESASGITLTKCGRRRLRKALRKDPKLDVAEFARRAQLQDAAKIWALMSDEERIRFMKSIGQPQPSQQETA